MSYVVYQVLHRRLPGYVDLNDVAGVVVRATSE